MRHMFGCGEPAAFRSYMPRLRDPLTSEVGLIVIVIATRPSCQYASANVLSVKTRMEIVLSDGLSLRVSVTPPPPVGALLGFFTPLVMAGDDW